MRSDKEEGAPLQVGGRGLSEREQVLLVQLGRMMGPQSDEFDDEFQRLHDIRHQAEHNATNYEEAFADIPSMRPKPQEQQAAKMWAAQRGGTTGLGPTEAEAALAKQRGMLQQQAASAGAQQAQQAQQQQPVSQAPPAPSG